MEDHDVRVEGQLAGEQDLLHVPPGQCPRARLDGGAAYVEAPYQLLGALADRSLADPPVAPERRLADPLQEDVQRHAQFRDDAFAQPVVGEVAQSELFTLDHVQVPNRRTKEADLAAIELSLSADGLRERALAVAVDARDAHDLSHPQR